MQYDDIFNTHCNIELKSGRLIRMDEIVQLGTYAGLLAGTPSADTNDWNIDRALQRARSRTPACPVLLVEPIRRDFRKVPGDMADVPNNRADRRIEWLPEVTSIAEFHSYTPARFPHMNASMLIVVWFQPDFGLPDAEFVQQHLTTIDWNSHAMDYEW